MGHEVVGSGQGRSPGFNTPRTMVSDFENASIRLEVMLQRTEGLLLFRRTHFATQQVKANTYSSRDLLNRSFSFIRTMSSSSLKGIASVAYSALLSTNRIAQNRLNMH